MNNSNPVGIIERRMDIDVNVRIGEMRIVEMRLCMHVRALKCTKYVGETGEQTDVVSKKAGL